MLNPNEGESISESCHRHASIFLDMILSAKLSPNECREISYALAVAFDIGEVLFEEETGRRAWEFYLATVLFDRTSSDLRNRIVDSATRSFRVQFQDDKWTACLIVIMYMSLDVESIKKYFMIDLYPIVSKIVKYQVELLD